MNQEKEPVQLIITLVIDQKDQSSMTLSVPVPITQGESPGSIWKRIQGRLFAALSVFLTGENPPMLDLKKLSAEDGSGTFRNAGEEDAAAAQASQEVPPKAPGRTSPEPRKVPEPPPAPERAPAAKERTARAAPQAAAAPPAAPEPLKTGASTPPSVVPNEALPPDLADEETHIGCRRCGRAFTKLSDAKEHVKTCKAKLTQPTEPPKPVQAEVPLPEGDPADEGLPPNELDQMEAELAAKERGKAAAATPPPERKPTDLSPEENTRVQGLIAEIRKLIKTWNGDWSITEPVFLNHHTREAEFAYKVNDIAVLTAIRDEFLAMAKRREEALAKAAASPHKKR